MTDQTKQEPAIPATDEEWRRVLTPEQFHILREKGTERAGTGEYAFTKDHGVYRCAGCGAELFSSDTKFESGTGWPSFYQPIRDGAITLHTDRTFGMTRVEATCARCGGHLGHVFDDGPRPTGERFCMNSASLTLDRAPD
jgi:peptide-methionine (R)-S-oxide reductase